jgi:hypothetical protein
MGTGISLRHCWAGCRSARAFAALGLLLAFTAGTGHALRGSVAATTENHDLELLREMAVRLADVSYTTDDVFVLPRRIPEGIPLPATFPDEGWIVGTVARGPAPERLRSVTVFGEAPGDATAVLGDIEASLGEVGWYRARVPFPAADNISAPAGLGSDAPTPIDQLGRFDPSSYRSGTLCMDEGALMQLHIWAKGDGNSRFTANVQPRPSGSMGMMCTGTMGPPSMPPPGPFSRGAAAIPPLAAPAGVLVRSIPVPGSQGLGPIRSESAMVARTELNSAGLESAYADQLAAGGWTRVDGRDDGVLAWSRWIVPGEGVGPVSAVWHGLLVVMAVPGEDLRLLSVRVSSFVPEGSEPSSETFSVRADPGASMAADLDDPAALRTLIDHALGDRAVPISGTVSESSYYVGTLPPHGGFELPVPPGARLLGSVMRSGMTTVAVDAPGSYRDVAAFFERTLTSDGWVRTGPSATPSGFQNAGVWRNSQYCHPSAGQTISLGMRELANGVQDVRVMYTPPLLPSPYMTAPPVTPGAYCAPIADAPGGPRGPISRLSESDPSQIRLPALTLPHGAVLDGAPSAGGGSFGRAQQDAAAQTTQSAVELEAYLADQLPEGGWSRLAGHGEGALAWSLWRVPGGETTYGLLLVVDDRGENRRTLSIRIEPATLWSPGIMGPTAPPRPDQPPAEAEG